MIPSILFKKNLIAFLFYFYVYRAAQHKAKKNIFMWKQEAKIL